MNAYRSYSYEPSFAQENLARSAYSARLERPQLADTTSVLYAYIGVIQFLLPVGSTGYDAHASRGSWIHGGKR